MLKITFYSS